MGAKVLRGFLGLFGVRTTRHQRQFFIRGAFENRRHASPSNIRVREIKPNSNITMRVPTPRGNDSARHAVFKDTDAVRVNHLRSSPGSRREDASPQERHIVSGRYGSDVHSGCAQSHKKIPDTAMTAILPSGLDRARSDKKDLFEDSAFRFRAAWTQFTSQTTYPYPLTSRLPAVCGLMESLKGI